MNRPRNIFVTVFFLLFLTGPALVCCAEGASIELPGWLSGEDAQYLTGDGGDNSLKTIGLRSFASKELQASVETELGRHIPVKSAAMLSNAAAQRQAISLSNALFQWSCYPTFFGSKYLYLPAEDALARRPERYDSHYTRNLETFAQGIADAARKHPDKRFVVVLAAGYQTPAVNPAYDLMSRPLTLTQCVAALSDQLQAENVSNVSFVTDAEEYVSETDYYRNYLKSDHHWNVGGTVICHNKIADVLGLQTLEYGKDRPLAGATVSGSTARGALMSLEEPAVDADIDLSGVTVLRDDGSSFPASEHEAYWNASEIARKFNFYELYYGDLGEFTLVQPQAETGASALLITNSYGVSIERLLAPSYKSMKRLHDLWPNKENGGQTFAKYIEEFDANDIIFIATAVDYSMLADHLPQFWD